jgi:hypothetical protein
MSDRLERAFRALRELEDGSSLSSEETLARIVADRRVRRRTTPKVPGTWMLIAAVLAFATAAAAGGERFGHALRAVMGWRTGEGSAAPASTSRGPRGPGGPPSIERLTGPPEAPPVPTSPVAEQPEEPPAPVASDGPTGQPISSPKPPAAAAIGAISAPAAPRHVLRAAGTAAKAQTVPGRLRPDATPSAVGQAVAEPSAVAPVPAAPSAVAPAPAAPSEVAQTPAGPPSDDAAYLRAHRLHFGGGDPAAALAAWDAYLQAFPDGRFAPEARYNRAIDLLKLRRYDEARLALQPFAGDAYGSYHRDDARAILRSLRPGP